VLRAGSSLLVAAWATARLVMLVAALMIPSMLVWTVVPTLFGWHSELVLTGSMVPKIRPGDVVVAQPRAADQVEPGQVVLVVNPARPGTLLLHRIVRRDPDGSLVTRGDANPSPDSTPVMAAQVRGLGRLKVPYIGLPVIWARDGRVPPRAVLAMAVAVVAGAAWIAAERRTPPGRRRARS
jgi:signal peptidase